MNTGCLCSFPSDMLLYSLADIEAWGDDLQMVRPDAAPISANVVYFVARGDFSTLQHPGDSMRKIDLSIYAKMAISLLASTRQPIPARAINPIGLAPKPLSNFRVNPHAFTAPSCLGMYFLVSSQDMMFPDISTAIFLPSDGYVSTAILAQAGWTPAAILTAARR